MGGDNLQGPVVVDILYNYGRPGATDVADPVSERS